MSRTWAWKKQLSELMGFLLQVSFAVRPGRCFVMRLRADVRMLQSAAESRVSPVERGQRVVLWSGISCGSRFLAMFCESGFRSHRGMLVSAHV